MAETVSLEGPVEIVDGKLAILIPLEAGGTVLAPFARGIGEIDGDSFSPGSRRSFELEPAVS
jgi:hypothetical protein